MSRCELWLFFISIIALFSITETALPPGYEDELYCPENMCLKRASHLRSWSGPKTMFFVCVHIESGASAHPRGWGDEIDTSVKEKWVSEGWKLAQECDKNQNQTNKNDAKPVQTGSFFGLFAANNIEKYI